MTRYLFKITWKWSNAKKLVGSQFTIILVLRSPPVGHPTKFYTGRFRPKFPPQEPFINCSFERKDTSFIYRLSSNGLPLTDIPTILDRIKWNNKAPSPLNQGWSRAKAKTRHFPILDFGGKAFNGFNCTIFYIVRVNRSKPGSVLDFITAIKCLYFPFHIPR